MFKKNKKLIYQILFFIVSIVFIIVFIKQFGKLSSAVSTLAQGSWYFLLAVILVQVLAIINRGAFYQTLYDFFSVNDSLKKLVLISLASNFMNLVAPAGGLSGIAVFVAEAEHQGMSKSRATFVNFFGYFLYYGVFVLALLFGLFYLMFNHQLYHYQTIAASVLFGMIFILLIILIVAIEGAVKLKKLFVYVAAVINFVARIINRKRATISKDAIHDMSDEVESCLKIIGQNWRRLWLPLFHVVLIEAIDIITLYYLFLAFKFPIYPGTLITVYAIGVLFTLISITPGGMGVVEATMILVLTNLSVPIELSAIAVLGYRVLTFWFPFIFGYFAFRTLQREKIIKISNGST